MFARAYQIASRFTFPVVVFRRFFDGEVQSSLATFIIVNEEGWLLTAAHVVSEIPLIQRHREAIAAYEEQAAAIAADERLTAKQKRTRVAHLAHDDRWLTHLSFLWGPGDVAVHDFKVDPVADLAAGASSRRPRSPPRTTRRSRTRRASLSAARRSAVWASPSTPCRPPSTS